MATKTATPCFSVEDTSRYNAGLKALVVDLKKSGVRDPEAVIDRVVHYRRDFLGDPFKVLCLEP